MFVLELAKVLWHVCFLYIYRYLRYHQNPKENSAIILFIRYRLLSQV
jgi:hypothetical protein